MAEKVRIEAEFDEDQAWALAEFLKRAHPEDFARRAGDSTEADQMWNAGLVLRQALTDKGFAPR
ncbi:hypothetical protein D3C71_259140 [compost metagenome]